MTKIISCAQLDYIDRFPIITKLKNKVKDYLYECGGCGKPKNSSAILCKDCKKGYQ